MKLNNKGFAISTILYGLLALVVLILMLIFAVMRSSNNNSKELGESINNELNACRQERIKYNSDTSNKEELDNCLKGIKKSAQCLEHKLTCNKNNNCNPTSDPWKSCISS